nr:hypothetical protein [Tanacetum cinerariifolium]
AARGRAACGRAGSGAGELRDRRRAQCRSGASTDRAGHRRACRPSLCDSVDQEPGPVRRHSTGVAAMTLPDEARTALETFGSSLSWEQRARLLMQWGDRLPAMADDEKTDEHLVDGCESKVWLLADVIDGHWQFRAASDAR